MFISCPVYFAVHIYFTVTSHVDQVEYHQKLSMMLMPNEYLHFQLY